MTFHSSLSLASPPLWWGHLTLPFPTPCSISLQASPLRRASWSWSWVCSASLSTFSLAELDFMYTNGFALEVSFVFGFQRV